MAYSTSSPPYLQTQAPGAGIKTWVYTTTDAKETVDGDGYFTNGKDLGFTAGDLIIIKCTDGTNPEWVSATILSVATTTCDISDTTVIGSTTDSD
jgi:hypothetical protein